MPRTSLEADKAEILDLHREWWLSNEKLNIDRMRPNFVADDNYFMFNYNGFSYFGLDEKVALWEYLHQWDVDWTELETFLIKFEVWGDTAWLAAEGRRSARRRARRETGSCDSGRPRSTTATTAPVRRSGRSGICTFPRPRRPMTRSRERPTRRRSRSFGRLPGQEPVRIVGA